MKNQLNTALAAIVKKFDFLETLFIIGFAVGMFLLISEIHIAAPVLWASLGGIILLYWIMSFYKPNKEVSSKDFFLKKITWLSFAIATLGILLKVQFNEKAEYALLLGIIGIAVAISVNLYLIIFKKEKKLFKNIIRGIVLALVTTILLIL